MNKYIKGLVSVIIPTYKRSDSLVKAVESVIRQTYSKLEIIVVNDNVPNDEYSLLLYDNLKTITDERVIFIEQEKHINGAAARNCGIRIAKGEYIAFLDDDDYWFPQKIEHQINAFKDLGDEWGAVSSMVVRYKNGKLIMAALPYKSGYILQDIMQRTIDISTISVLIKREALDRSGYFDENLSRHQDVQLFTCLAYNCKIYLLKEYLQIINVDDSQNRPSSEKIIAIKNAYYNSVSGIVDTLTAKQKKQIFILNQFEIAAILFKEKKYKDFLVNVISVLKMPSTLILSLKRTLDRIISTKFKHYLYNKYKVE